MQKLDSKPPLVTTDAIKPMRLKHPAEKLSDLQLSDRSFSLMVNTEKHHTLQH